MMGNGNFSDSRTAAGLLADCWEKSPVITSHPSDIGALITGSEIITLSRTIAKWIQYLLGYVLPGYLQPLLKWECNLVTAVFRFPDICTLKIFVY